MARIMNRAQLRAQRGGFDRPNVQVDGATSGTKSLFPDVKVLVLTATGGTTNAFSLKNGYIDGHEIVLYLKTKGGAGNAVVTPVGVWGGTTLTFDAANEVAHLCYLNGKWKMIGGDATLA